MNKDDWYSIKNITEDTAELSIDGVIANTTLDLDGEVGAREFIGSLRDIQAKKMNIYLNSPGGDLFAGIAIYNALKQHPATKRISVGALAASMGSVVAMAGDEIIIPENSFMMIHNPMTIVFGSASAMRKRADVLDQMKASLICIYKEKTGCSEEEIAKMMDDETWMNGKEAVAKKFATECTAPVTVAAHFTGFDMRQYKKVPTQIVNVARSDTDMTPEEIADIANKAVAKALETQTATVINATTEAFKPIMEGFAKMQTAFENKAAEEAKEAQRKADITQYFEVFEPENRPEYGVLKAQCLADGASLEDARTRVIALRNTLFATPPAAGVLNAATSFAEDVDPNKNQGEHPFLAMRAKLVKEGMNVADATRHIVVNHADVHASYIEFCNKKGESDNVLQQ